MNKILVINRGEIALRIMKTIKKLGMIPVAVFSEADRDAPFVLFADEAFCIGAAPSEESYLNISKIIEVCLLLKVDAVHPGYGFLSENAQAAKKFTENGITFIGPSQKSIEIMGNKLESKKAVSAYNIPLLGGSKGAVTDLEDALKTAKKIGYPILIKASNGGGGKGMRLVEKEKDLKEQIKRAQSESKSAFGDDTVFIEKYVTSPKHIEFQVLCDKKGNFIHLFDRECSIQRRHQKVIEEAPSPSISEDVRVKMGACAINVAKSCDYLGAGTVEFLVDEKQNFYFLEMNTRLQVEHPVTEMITGIDLVEQQIRIAQGMEINFKQEDLKIQGHAIEIRVYAEDPENNFLPSIGKLEEYTLPKGKGIRVDDGYRKGMNIPIFYDPMISKLVVHSNNREGAIAKMIFAIENYFIKGVSTTLDFCKFVLNHKAFKDGSFTTHFVSKHYKGNLLKEKKKELEEAGAVIIANLTKASNDKISLVTKHSKHWKNRLSQ